MKWWAEPVAIALSLIVVIVIIVIFVDVGLSLTQPHIKPTPTPEPVTTEVTEILTTPPATVPETTPPTPETTTPSPTPTLPPTWAAAATPIEDPNTYDLTSNSTFYNPAGQNFPVIFQQSYTFKYQYEAVIAKVAKPPLIIDFAVSPGSSTPTLSFFLITVRDNATEEILAQDGYFRSYSSNSPKTLYFSSAGTYHINMYGAFVGVDLTIMAPTS